MDVFLQADQQIVRMSLIMCLSRLYVYGWVSNTRAGSFLVGGSCPLPAVGCYSIYIKQHFWLLSTKCRWHPLPAVTSSVPPDIAKGPQDPSQGSLEETEMWSVLQNWVTFVLGW